MTGDENIGPFPTLVFPDNPKAETMFQAVWEAARQNLLHSPEGSVLGCMPGVDKTWLWDSCFTAIFGRYASDLLPVQNTLDQFYRQQTGDGFIGMAYDWPGGDLSYGERINPPLLAWAEWLLFEMTGDRDRLAKITDPVVQLHRWINLHRRRTNGLYWFEDPGSSGMDNAPRGGYASPMLNGSDLCHVDLLAQQALTLQCLNRIGHVLGDDELCSSSLEEHRHLRDLAERYHWSDRAGFYLDVFLRSSPNDRHNLINHLTIAGFWPMIANLTPQSHVDRLVQHLTDPATFGTPHRVPSLAAHDPNYDPRGGYWLGAVWSPTTYMVCAGLAQQGRMSMAHQIALDHLNQVSAVFEDPQFTGLWECYSPEDNRPATAQAGRSSRANFVGWTGLAATSLVIEFIMGLSLSASSNTISWTPQQPGRQGIRDLKFNGGTISAVGVAEPDAGRYTLEVTTLQPVNVVIDAAGGRQTAELPSGTHRVLHTVEALRQPSPGRSDSE